MDVDAYIEKRNKKSKLTDGKKEDIMERMFERVSNQMQKDMIENGIEYGDASWVYKTLGWDSKRVDP